MRRRTTSLAGIALATALAVSACGGQQDRAAAGAGADESSCDAGSGRVNIATGNSTGVYFVVGGGLAQVINKETDLQATAAETGASVQNIQQLADGDYDIGFSLADTASDAVNGENSFDSPQDVSSLGRIYSNYTQVVVQADSGIDSVEDFKGKRISTGSPQSGTEVIANRMIEVAGLQPGDVKAQRLDLDQTVAGMKDGSIDGLVWSGGLPTPAITDLFTSMGDKVKFIDVTPLLGGRGP
jgi:TRAP transporter TAXI family solute receptor